MGDSADPQGGQQRGDLGGILSLVKLIDEHGEAIEYDLMTKAGLSLMQLGNGLSWMSLASFVKHLHGDSAYLRETCGEAAEWAEQRITNNALADMFDMINSFRCIYINSKGGDAGTPVRYPRPGMGSEETEPMTRDEFYDWMMEVVADG